MSKVILIISSIVFVLAVYVVFLFVPMKKTGKQVDIVIEPGTAVRSIADLLQEKKIISYPTVFIVWIKLNKLEKSIQAGKVSFFENEGIIKAARKLRFAKAIETEITILEGFTIDQTAHRVAQVFSIDTSEFVKLCYDKNFIHSLGMDVPSLEGFLFPNTYRFRPDVKSKEIISRVIKQFKSEYKSIKQNELSKQFTQLEIVTLASIVEKEATLPEERTHISGVFHNRLRLHIPLGADPTVRYFLKKFSGPLRVSELKNPSPYNTRIHTGLTPGPICSPGKKSIEAAINPITTKDLFFVAKWDGSGAHDFSETGAQHERKKHEIRKRNEIKKRNQKKGQK